ncbi:Rrf2 family transcriptional regulator (plasmid) [Acuticoccus sp. I52.16.1]|nr:Rrf2 family transcriptional regulator [Acuticoccus sp. I52.16.1]UOM37298.1 Rrf2 family transcriptional regulator [Acuticoccus sp. I52.16.1]
MRFTDQTRYALQVLTYCAERHPDLVQVSAIAADTDLTEYTIYKLLKIATKEGIIASTRGRGGGIRLARDPHRITVGSVIRMFEPRFRECAPASMMRASDDPREARTRDADMRLDSALGAGIRAVLDTYDAITLIDLMDDGARRHDAGDANENGPAA